MLDTLPNYIAVGTLRFAGDRNFPARDKSDWLLIGKRNFVHVTMIKQRRQALIAHGSWNITQFSWIKLIVQNLNRLHWWTAWRSQPITRLTCAGYCKELTTRWKASSAWLRSFVGDTTSSDDNDDDDRLDHEMLPVFACSPLLSTRKKW